VVTTCASSRRITKDGQSGSERDRGNKREEEFIGERLEQGARAVNTEVRGKATRAAAELSGKFFGRQ